MGADLCTGSRREIIDNRIPVKDIFKGSTCYRKNTKKNLRKKVRKYRSKIKLLEEEIDNINNVTPIICKRVKP